jgi:hypothetical protein
MARLRDPDTSHGPFPEKTTRVITATVKDENNVAIPGASLTTMTWTLYAEQSATLAIINSRTTVDCKPNVDANGLLTLTLLPADMVILDDTLILERHRILFEWTYSAGKAGKHEAQIIVSNLAKVT